MADEAQLRAWLLAGLQGDEAAHRAFLSAAAGLLRAYFRNRLRGAPEEAEDLVQETLVALHTRRDSYDPAFPLTAWMYAIARYRLIDYLRRTKRRGVHVLDFTSRFCTRRWCYPVIGGVLVHNDVSHMTDTWATSLGPVVLKKINDIAGG